jgi:hypothetical protein
MGLKTNLLSDVLMIPEVGLEFQLSRKVSLDIQGWLTDYNILTPTDKNASIYGFAPEIRWWKDEAMRTGSFYGVHAHCAWYTLQWKDLLYQNGPDNIWEGNYHDSGNSTPAWSVGFTYGYVVGLGPQKNWGLEFVVGLGYGRYQQNTGIQRQHLGTCRTSGLPPFRHHACRHQPYIPFQRKTCKG